MIIGVRETLQLGCFFFFSLSLFIPRSFELHERSRNELDFEPPFLYCGCLYLSSFASSRANEKERSLSSGDLPFDFPLSARVLSVDTQEVGIKLLG